MKTVKWGIILLAFLLAAMVTVPMVNADTSSSATQAHNLSVSNAKINIVSSKIAGHVSPESNVNMSKEEFLKANAEYIKFLSKNLNQSEINQMMDSEYNKAYGKTSTTALTVTPMDLSTIVQIGGYDIYIWPYSNTVFSTASSSGNVNLIFFGMTKSQVKSYMENSASILYDGAEGTAEYGYRGSSVSSMSWTTTIATDQLEYGDYFTSRYHLILFEGGYSSGLGKNWCYGQTHYEYWSNTNPGTGAIDPNHYLYSNAFDVARTFFNQAINGAKPSSMVYVYNPWSGYADGYAYIYYMA